MKMLLKGDINFIRTYNNWIIDVLVGWNRSKIEITIKSRNSELKSEFETCVLTKGNFLSFISRSDIYNFSGKKSAFSELILKSRATQSLMYSRNPSIRLKGKYLIFNGGIRKYDESSLSNIFILNEILLDEIDLLNCNEYHHNNFFKTKS